MSPSVYPISQSAAHSARPRAPPPLLHLSLWHRGGAPPPPHAHAHRRAIAPPAGPPKPYSGSSCLLVCSAVVLRRSPPLQIWSSPCRIRRYKLQLFSCRLDGSKPGFSQTVAPVTSHEEQSENTWSDVAITTLMLFFLASPSDRVPCHACMSRLQRAPCRPVCWVVVAGKATHQVSEAAVPCSCHQRFTRTCHMWEVTWSAKSSAKTKKHSSGQNHDL
jgi:hypothetical protein